MSQANFSVPIHTGDPSMDQQQAQQMVQQYAAQGMTARVEPNPSGGLVIHVAMGQQPMGQQPMGQQPMGQQPMGQAPMGQAPMGQQPMGQQPMGQQPMGQQPMGQAPTGGGAAGASEGKGGKLKQILSGVFVLLLVVGGGGAAAWMHFNPLVYVDNPTSNPVTVFVDGKKKKTVAAGKHTSFRVGSGGRTLGWAAASASKPSSTTKTKIKGGKKYLYNPGMSGCYWLKHDRYGNSAGRAPKSMGPQPLAEVYEFNRVDNWFRENPNSVKTKKKSNVVRVALQRAKICSSWSHCPVKVRVALMNCVANAYRAKKKDAFNACGSVAARSCKPKN